MADVQNNAWPDEGLWQRGGYQHEQSPGYSYLVQDFRTSSAADPPYQYVGVSGFASSQSFSNIPRYISDHTLTQRPRMQEYEHEQLYTTARANHNYRERSSSGPTPNYSHVRSATTSPSLAHYHIAADNQYVGTFLSRGESFGDTSVTHNGSDLSTFDYTEEETHEDTGEEQHAKENASVNRAANSKERLPCTHADCRGDDGEPKRFFSRKADVNRHYKSQHEVTRQDCPWPKCGRKGTQGFARSDHLTEHRRGYHQEHIPKRSGGNTSEKQDETSSISSAGSSFIAQQPRTGTGTVSIHASASVSSSSDNAPTIIMAEMSDRNLTRIQTYYQERDTAVGALSVARKRKAGDEDLDADEDSRGEHATIGDPSKRRKMSRFPLTTQTSQGMTQWELELMSADRGPYYRNSQQQLPHPRQQHNGNSRGRNESMMYGSQSQTQAQAQDRSGSEKSTTSPSFYLQSHKMEPDTQAPRMPRYYPDQRQTMQTQFG